MRDPVNHLNALDGTGYQFVQTRGLVVIDSPIGLVACLPMGMAQVSSVVLTAEVGVTFHKGEELGYFSPRERCQPNNPGRIIRGRKIRVGECGRGC